MRFHIQDSLWTTKAIMKPVPYLLTRMVRCFDQVQWAFSGIWGNVKLISLLRFSHDICCWASFNHVLHMRIKFRNRLDISTDRWKRHTTDDDQFVPCFKKLADKKPGARFAVVGRWTRAVVPVPAPVIQNFLLRL